MIKEKILLNFHQIEASLNHKFTMLKLSFKYYTILISIFYFIVLNSSYSFSQGKKIITNLDEAISLALSNNSDLEIARLEKLRADARVSEVYSENLVPALSLNSRYSRAFKKQIFDIGSERFEIGADNGITSTLDVTESLPVLGTPVFTGIRIAEYFSNIQKENIRSIETNVKNNVKRAYYTVLLSKAVVNVNTLTLENARENFEVVEAKYRNGIATEFDYLRARVRFDNTRPSLINSEKNLEISEKALLNVIGLKVNQDLEVFGELAFDSSEVWSNTDVMINKISEQNVAIRLLTINKRINQELVKIVDANFLPKLYLFGQYGLFAQENDGRKITNYRFFNSLNAGLGLTWDLNLFKNSFRKRQSEIEVLKTEEQISDLKQKLKLSSESTIIALEDAKERIRSQRGTIALAERGLELATISYRSGVINQIDIQDAELILYQSRLQYLQAIYDYQIAKAELERLLEK